MYEGTIVSAFLWGYLFDTMGRKKLLVAGFLLNGFIDALCSLSQDKIFLMVMKFMGGFIMNGPYAALTSYVSELHSSNYRSRVPILFGFWNAIGNIYLALLGFFILPMNLELVIAEHFVFHSWGLFILLNSLPALLSGVCFIMLPESPKFLMTMGKNDEALQVFRKIYSVNTGNPPEMYPVKMLIKEVNEDKVEKSGLKEGWSQIRPLFSSPFLNILMLVCAIQTFSIMSLNTLRLWLPQLFQAINDYKFSHNGTTSTLCVMLSTLSVKPEGENNECYVNMQNFDVYMNLMIVSITTACSYVVAGSIVNKLGPKRLLLITSFITGIFVTGLYFAPNSAVAIVLLAGFTSLGSILTNVVLVIVVNLFPTTLRTMTVSLVMMFGRGAAMIGNIIFPYLIELGCGPPIFSTAAWILVCFVLSLWIPRENKNFI